MNKLQYENLDILVIPTEMKENYLEMQDKENKLLNLKIMSKKEFMDKLTYTYNDDTIYYCMKKYNVKYDIAKTYIQNTYYIIDKEYNHEKLNFIKYLKKDLLENNLLKENKLFKKYVKTHSIAFYNCDLEPYEKEILKEYSIKEINNEKIKEKEIHYFEFNTMEEEIDFIANEIIKLYEKDIPFNNIKIMNAEETYYHTLEKIFNFYNIPINIPSEKTIFGTMIGHFTLDNLDMKKEDLIDTLKEKFDYQNDENKKIIDRIIKIFNNYTNIENLKELEEIIKENFKNTTISKSTLKNAVEIINPSKRIFKDDEYVFLVGCNQGSFPTIYKDEDFISDALKDEVLLNKTSIKNKLAKENAKKLIYSIPNLTITYKLETPFDSYLKSSLLTEINAIKDETPNYLKHYSKLYDQIKLAKFLDEYNKFGTETNDLKIYLSNYPNIDYQTYDNSFKGIKNETLLKRLNNKLSLSYTSLDSYNRCNFRYFVNRILKCDPYEETFAIFIGNLFHYILSQAFNDNFDFEKEWNLYLTKKETFKPNELFFLKNLKEELKFDIETIKEQNKHISLKNAKYEEKINVLLENKIPVNFNGIIDKIYFDEEKNIASIVDYKTGTLHTDLNGTIYGINMQLPIYLYLLKRHPNLNKPKVIGFYLQKIVNGKISLEEHKKAMKLVGYSTTNKENLEKFDDTYEDSTLIKSMKISKGNFSGHAKVLDDEKQEKLEKIVSEKINEGITGILNGDFKINPKVIGTDLIGCANCPYGDICFMKEKDKVYLSEHKKLDFLESGEENAKMD